jgi:hypothetical protein
LNLWSSARYDLHLSETEFWKLTGRQLSALTHRHKYAQDRQQWLCGLLASVTANFSMCRPKEPLGPQDFMPPRKERERTEQEIAIDFAEKMQFIAVCNGSIKLPPVVH